MPPIIETIVEQHAREAALLWPLRDAAATQPQYTLPRLGRIDDRIEAHLDGLRIAGDAGWEICKAGLDEDAGEVFAATVLAVERGDLVGIAEILDLGGGIHGLARAVVSALGWAPWSKVAAILPGLLEPACPPELQFLGVGGCAVHRMDPGDALRRALGGDDARLRRRALEAVGELGRKDLLQELRRHVGTDVEGLRFVAAASLVRLGDALGVPVLWEIAQTGGPRASAAISLGVRRVDPVLGATWIRTLAGRHESLRTALIGAGALGEPAHVPWLLDCMAIPDVARPAGEAFTLITGIDLEDEGLSGAPPTDFKTGPTEASEDEDVAMDPDEHLPWPDVAAVRARWQLSGARLESGTRHILGLPIAPAWLQQVLRRGNQRQRAAAAMELALISTETPFFEVRAPAFRQRRLLGS